MGVQVSNLLTCVSSYSIAVVEVKTRGVFPIAAHICFLELRR
jgi:hypothetical protein